MLLIQAGAGLFCFLSETIAISAEEAYGEHLAIIEALKQGDLNEVGRKMTIHLDNIEKRLLKTIK